MIAQILVTILMVIAMLPAIIAGVAVGVALKAPEIAILLGVVLMFPAIFLVYALTILAQFFIVDRELDAISAIKASFDAGRTSMLGMLLFFLAMFGLFVAGFLACILPAFFVVAPMLGLAVSHIYERLSPLVEA